MNKPVVVILWLAFAGAACGADASTAPFIRGTADAYRFDVGDASFIVYGRVPTKTGQELYLQYWTPYYEKADPVVLVRRGGFVLAGGVNRLSPEIIETVARQPIYESDGYLLRLVYKGTVGGDLTLRVEMGDGSEGELAVGAGGGAYRRTGVVTAESGVRVRAAPDTAAISSGVMKTGEKIWFTGRECGFIPPGENIEALVVFREILRGGETAWIAVNSWREGDYVEMGDLQPGP